MSPPARRSTVGVSSRRAAQLLLFLAAAAMSGGGCPNLFKPSPPPSGFEQCGAVNALYCNSAVVPQTLQQGVPGTCCVVVNNPYASIGYLCAYGAGHTAVGCFATLDDARQVCPTAPSIVRCTR
jgi:hypothetical protein